MKSWDLSRAMWGAQGLPPALSQPSCCCCEKENKPQGPGRWGAPCRDQAHRLGQGAGDRGGENRLVLEAFEGGAERICGHMTGMV